MNQILPSLIRTVVPLLVAFVTALLVKAGIDPGPYQDLLAQLAGALVATVYYAIIRLFETYVKPRIGWLLGWAKQPTYDAPAAPSTTSPTGYEATPDAPADIPAGEPVEVTEAPDGTRDSSAVDPVYDSPDDPAFGAGVGAAVGDQAETVQSLVDDALGRPYQGKHAAP